MTKAFEIGGEQVAPGSTRTVDIPIGRLATRLPMSLSVRVVHGRRAGPVFFASAGIHGDEVMGVEIIRRLLRAPALKSLVGTLLCVPIVNVYGFISHTRYLPDRRDLNRSFPGTSGGSLAAQLAYRFRTEIVERSNAGIDIHTAALHRSNFPQLRLTPGKPQLEAMAEAFAPPCIIASGLREGSLRHAAAERDVDVLVYEAGEALRFDELSIHIGVQGILRVMAHLGMLPRRRVKMSRRRPVHSTRSQWVRAPESGVFRAMKTAGDRVEPGETLGFVSDPFGDVDIAVTSPEHGIVIGRSRLPVVSRGDALLHIAVLPDDDLVYSRIADIAKDATIASMLDEDEVI